MDNPLIGPYRVFPGRLSVCRTFGDLEAKKPQLGGNPNVVICDPDVNYQRDGCKKLDYVLTCSDGIFDKLNTCLLYTSPSPRDRTRSRMPSSA